MPDLKELDDDKLFAIELEFDCPYKWKTMWGDDRIRFCGACKKNVYNISKLTKDEALELINSKEEGLCVTFYRRKNGTVITRDCVSAFGMNSIKEKNNFLAMLNFTISSIALSLLPLLGPACITVVNGGMGPQSVSRKEKSVIEIDENNLPGIRFDPFGNAISKSHRK